MRHDRCAISSVSNKPATLVPFPYCALHTHAHGWTFQISWCERNACLEKYLVRVSASRPLKRSVSTYRSISHGRTSYRFWISFELLLENLYLVSWFFLRMLQQLLNLWIILGLFYFHSVLSRWINQYFSPRTEIYITCPGWFIAAITSNLCTINISILSFVLRTRLALRPSQDSMTWRVYKRIHSEECSNYLINN